MCVSIYLMRAGKIQKLASFRMSISICPFPTSCELLKDFLSNCKPFMSFSGCALEDEDPPAAMCARVSGSLFSAKERANVRRIERIIFDRLNSEGV